MDIFNFMYLKIRSQLQKGGCYLKEELWRKRERERETLKFPLDEQQLKYYD